MLSMLKNRSSFLLAFLLSLSLLGATYGLWRPHVWLGYWPNRFMNYAERRLVGHPELQSVFMPAILAFRNWVDLPEGAAEEAPFIVPPPPDLIVTPDPSPAAPLPGFSGRILHVGPTRALTRPSEAARVARDGDEVDLDSGVYPGDVAVWTQKSLVLRGVNGHARILFMDRTAEGKALWVMRGGPFLVENVDFIGAQAPDGNGAGIRFETGQLTLNHCLFYDNQDGLLTSNDPTAELVINDSEFGYNGSGTGQTHDLYAGSIRLLRVRGSFFHHANVGHLLKSRAAFNDIAYNRLTDGPGGRASYELDLPAGGVARVLGNLIQQGDSSENSNIIAFGEEKYLWPDNRLYLASNTIVNDMSGGGTFLRVAPSNTGGVTVYSVNNLLVGKGDMSIPAGLALTSQNDVRTDWHLFVQPMRQDYHLKRPVEGLHFDPPAAPQASGMGLVPRFEYVHPLSVQPLTTPPEYPGALQTPEP